MLSGIGLAPQYLSELCVPVAFVIGCRQLRFASRALLYFPCYNMSNNGRCAFSYASPHVWNLLAENVLKSTTIFKRSLNFRELESTLVQPNKRKENRL